MTAIEQPILKENGVNIERMKLEVSYNSARAESSVFHCRDNRTTIQMADGWIETWGEILQEEQKRMQAFHRKRGKEQLAGVLERVAYLEQTMLTIITIVRNNEAKFQQRLDKLTGMLEVILNSTQQILLKPEERGARAASVLEATGDHDPHADASENNSTIDVEFSENAYLFKRLTTRMTGQPEVPTNGDSLGFPSQEEQLNHHSEPDDPQENPAKRQGPGEYSVTEELTQAVEFNSITRQNEMDDCEGTREDEDFDTTRFSDLIQCGTTDESSYIMCEENSWRGAAG